MRWIVTSDRQHRAIFALALFLAVPALLGAQDSGGQTGVPNAATDASAQKPDPGAVLKLLQQMQAELRDLHAEVKDLRSQQQASALESDQLRKELAAAQAQLVILNAPAPPEAPVVASGPTAATATAGSAPESSTSLDRIAKVEENQQMTDAKLADLNQSKVESGSRYRLRLTGILLFNIFGNQGTVDNIDFPQIATRQNFLFNDHSIGGSMRQSQIEIQAFGPTIAGARSSADLQFDFAGGFPNQPNGSSFGVMRLRTGTFRFDWANTSIVAGQDTLFFSPLTPTSLATIATPALSYSGNLWAWTPQIRVEHDFKISDSAGLKVQAGFLDPWSGEGPISEYFRGPSWGENSGVPAVAARVAWTQKLGEQKFVLGAGGYYSHQDWGFDRSIDSWVSTLDLSLPLTSRLEFTGQFFRGRALGGVDGGIGQSVIWNGSLADPTVGLHGLDAVGGWAQMKFKATPKLQFNAAFGQDNPFAAKLRLFNGNPIYNGFSYSKNQSGFVNLIMQPRSDVVFSFEYRRIWSFPLDDAANTANSLSFSLGYIF